MTLEEQHGAHLSIALKSM
ncbi:hypothetical protein A2U01_0069816, partial [Trifolium medium]|nr:hypothetical protein [Trifolium medium]